MSLRALLCVALLLVIPVLAQQSPSPEATAQPNAQLKTDSPVTNTRVECMPASRASELIGKHGCVAGRVFRVTTRKTGDTHLSLCPSRSKCSFQIVVFARVSSNVGDLTYLQGKLLAVIGDVVEFRGHPEIVVKDVEQLRVAASNPPPKFDAAQAKPSSTATPGSKRNRAW